MTRNKFTNKLLVLIVAITMCTVFLPSGAAAAHEDFGSFVLQEDDDFRPTLEQQAFALCRADFSTQGTVNDDAFYLSIGGDGSTTSLENHDVRLTERGGNAPGTLITDDDTTEKNQDVVCTASGDSEFHWIDADDDEDFTSEDFVYIGNETGQNVRGSSNDQVWIRLTDTDGGDAGTLVFSGDQDLTNYGDSQNLANADLGFFDADNDATFDSGDWLYIGTQTDFSADRFPELNDLRVVHPSEDFGSSVGLEDADFVPTLNDAAGTTQMCRIDFGDSNTITDDDFYLSVQTDNALDNYDIRLSDRGDGPGTLLQDGDTTEKTATVVDSTGGEDSCDNVADGTAELIAYDVDNDGDFNDGDYVYLGVNNAGDSNTLEGASDSNGIWYIRLTDTGSGDAGTLVLSGDQDLRTYGGQAADFDMGDLFSNVEFRYFDADNTASFTPGDLGYLSQDDEEGHPPLMFDIRLVHEEEAFGSLVTPGDDDFVPTLENDTNLGMTGLAICRADFGESGRISDDAFYLKTRNDNAAIQTFDIRLTDFGDNPRGTLVSDEDTTERNADNVSCKDDTDVELVFQDVDNDGDLTDADHAFIGFDQGADNLAGSTDGGSIDGGDWWVRLTDTSSHDAGTLVRSSHDDLITYGSGQEVSGATFGWFDANNDDSFNTGDWMYVTSAGISPGDTPPLYSIRVTGSFDVEDLPDDEVEGPSITIDEPQSDAEISIGDDVDISGTAEAGDNDIENVSVMVGDDELDVEGTEEWSATLEGIEAGDHTIQATVTDTEGNSDTASVTVTVEEEMPDAPEISITSPSDGTEIQPGEEVTIEGTASGEDVEVTVTAGDEDLDVSGTDDWSATWMASEEAGSFVITATVTDSADQTASDTVTVSVAEETTDDDEVDDQVDDEVDDETTDDEVETPGFSALAALIATVAMAALLRRN